MKKLILLIAAAALFTPALMFSGCLGNNPGGGKAGTLEISVFDGGYGTGWLTAMINAYKYENPGAEIKMVKATGAIGRSLQNYEIHSGAAPSDLYFLMNDVFREVNNAKLTGGSGSWYADISDVWNSIPEEQTASVKASMSPTFESYFNDNGKYYALPWATAAEGLVYHPNLFASKSWAVPRTTGELLKLAATIKNANAVNAYGKMIYPFSYSLSDEYWNMMFPIWFAQYEGRAGWDNYWQGIDYAGNKYAVSATRYLGIQRSLEVFQRLLANASNYNHPYSKSSDFTEMQFKFLDGESAMAPNGDWLLSEMRGDFTDDEVDIAFMKAPVNSAIVERLELYAQADKGTSYYNLTSSKQDAYDATLALIVADADADKAASAHCSAADFARVKEARSMVNAEGNVHLAILPSYKTINADMAKKFLTFMYSYKGAELFAANTKGCTLPMSYDLSDSALVSENSTAFGYSAAEYAAGASFVFKYNYRDPLFHTGNLRPLAGSVDNFVSLLGASSLTDYKSALEIYNTTLAYYETIWDDIVSRV